MTGPGRDTADPRGVVAVVGGGFCGSLTAVNLLRHGQESLSRVVLIDREGRFGPGVAYGTACQGHLLNVSASRMSAFDDEPDHFLRWASARRPGLEGSEFLPRAWYGEYVRSLLAAIGPSRLERAAGMAIDLEPAAEGFVVRLEGGRSLAAEALVLAVGNGPPSTLPLTDRSFLTSPRYIGSPWTPGSLANVGSNDRVLLVGTGLTMMDVVIELRSAGHRGPIEAVSRRGQLPTAHRPGGAAPYRPAQSLTSVFWERTALGLLRALRREVCAAEASSVDWREVVNGLRPITADLWGALPIEERKRFLTHLRPYWDTHRHRTATEVGDQVKSLITQGVLAVHAGRVESLRDTGDGAVAAIRRRGSRAATESCVQVVVNCTGPESDLRRWNDPLVNSLLKRRLARLDPLGLGLDTASDGRLIAAEGSPVEGLLAVGALRRGALWESTAVPELRGQAARAARSLAAAGLRVAAG